MPFFKSLYSRFFPTMGAISLCALAVFWYLEESPMISGDASACVNSTYFDSVCSRRSNTEVSLDISFPPSVPSSQLDSREIAAGALGNYQRAALLFLQRHGLVEGDNGALRLIVGGRLGGDPLQPQAGSSQQREQRTTVTRREANDLIRDSCDYRQHDYAHGELRAQR